jgi:hypothetical protein
VVQLKLPGITVTFGLKDPDKDLYMAGLEWSSEAAKEGEAFWVWILDAEGRILTETPRIEHLSGSMGGHVHVKGKMARAALVRVTGEEVVKSRFVVKGIPLPKK